MFAQMFAYSSVCVLVRTVYRNPNIAKNLLMLLDPGQESSSPLVWRGEGDAYGCLWVPMGAYGCLWVPIGCLWALLRVICVLIGLPPRCPPTSDLFHGLQLVPPPPVKPVSWLAPLPLPPPTSQAYFMARVADEWLSLRLDLIGAIIILSITLLNVVLRWLGGRGRSWVGWKEGGGKGGA